ncbi:MAG: MaoC/PaaZ C-terminal domain-containing protein [Caulobacterales bacterium]
MSQQASQFALPVEGDQIPVLAVHIDRAAIVRYCGASDDYTNVHWDQDHVKAQGFPDVIVHGWLVFAYMTQAVTNWIPREYAAITDFAVRYRRPVYPGPMSCGGKVLKRHEENGVQRIDLELWTKSGDGVTTTTATMTLEAN